MKARYELYGWRRMAGFTLWVLAGVLVLLSIGVALTPLVQGVLVLVGPPALVLLVVAYAFGRGGTIARWAGLVLALAVLAVAAVVLPALLEAPCPSGYVETFTHECMRWGSPVTWAIWVVAVAPSAVVAIGSSLPGRRERAEPVETDRTDR